VAHACNPRYSGGRETVKIRAEINERQKKKKKVKDQQNEVLVFLGRKLRNS
jgi:hypothetical protein